MFDNIKTIDILLQSMPSIKNLDKIKHVTIEIIAGITCALFLPNITNICDISQVKANVTPLIIPRYK